MIPARARLRPACALAAVAVAILGWAAMGAPAAAAPAEPGSGAGASGASGTTGALAPLVDCVQDAPLGAVTSRTIVFGYRSTASAAIDLPPGGGDNDLTSGAADRGQPASFQPGEHHGVWLLTVDAAAEPDLAWQLGGATVTPEGAPACTDATAVAVSAPGSVVAGERFAVSASVTRMLLAPPAAGSVEFAVGGSAPVRVPVSASGVARAELVAPAAGARSLTVRFLPPDGSTLRPAAATAALTVTPASGPLALAPDSVVAGSTSAVVTVSRESAAGSVTVDYTTADGTAVAGRDYASVSGTLTLADGQRTATISVPLRTRAAGSPAAAFFVLLQRASTTVGVASATVRLPEVPARAAAAAVTPAGSAAPPEGPSSSLPAADPTAPAARTGGDDLFLLLGAALLTVGGILGVVGLFRAVTVRSAGT